MPLFNPSFTTYLRFGAGMDVSLSGDLEPATKTITATAEASGVGNADYSWSKSFMNNNAYVGWLEILRAVLRLTVTIDSKTADTLYCRVYIDVQDDAHRMIDAAFTATGAQAAVNDFASDKLPTVLGALTDGAAHTIYVFLWVDSGDAVISELSLVVGPGSCDTVTARPVVRYLCQGIAAIGYNQRRYGTGTPVSWVGDVTHRWVRFSQNYSGQDTWVGIPSIVLYPGQTGVIFAPSTVATDMNYVRVFYMYLVR